eukprot:2229795-Amphidinium_carterae.1
MDDHHSLGFTLGQSNSRRNVPRAPLNLKDSVLPITALRYKHRVQHFAEWLLQHRGLYLAVLVKHVEQLVDCLQAYLQWMYEQNMP